MARKKVKALKGASRSKAPQPSPSKRRRLSDVYEVDDDEREDTVAEALDPEAFDPDADPDFGSDDESIDEEMAFTAEDTDLAAMFDADETGPGATRRYQGLDMDSDEEGDDEDEELARYLGEEEDVDGGGAGLVPSEEEAGHSGEEDESGGQRGDDSGTDEEQEQRHREMLEAVVGSAERKMGKRKRARQLVSEVHAEGELNVQHRTATAGGELRVADLVRGLGAAAAKLGGARKDLEKLDAAPVVEVPAAPVVKERAARQVAYQESKKEVGKWQAIVKTNREASTVWFKGAEGAPRLTTTAALAARADTPATDLEAEVAQLLQAAGAADARAVKDTEEALALKELTAEEMMQRRETMAKQQALLFYHELKAKRLKKIKSKAYHRRLTKATKRLAETQAEAELDEEEVQEQLQRAEFERAKERLTLRHKNSSRWARRALKRGLHLADDGARAAIAEQLRVGQELRQKARSMHAGSNSESDASSASDDDGEALTGKAKAAALEMLEDGAEAGESTKKGILSLPFMQRAMQRQREAAREEARTALREIEQWEGGGRAAGPAAAAADGGGGAPFGRMSFVAEDAAANAPVRGEHEEEEDGGVFDAGESSDEEPRDTQHLGNRPQNPSTRSQEQAGQLAAGRQVRQAAGEGAAPAAADGAHGTLLAHRITLSATNSSTCGRGVAGRSAAGVAQASRKQLFDAAARPHAGNEGSGGGATGLAGEAGAAFLRSSKFKGVRAGFVFKTGKKGLGYYRDNGTKLPGEASAQAVSAAGRSAAEKSMPEGEAGTGLEGRGAAGADDVEAHPKAMKPVGAVEQRQLIAEAFAGDDVQAEFERDKLRDVEEQVAHVEEPSVMPGWGSWGLKSEPKWLQEARQKAKQERQRLIAGRRDSKLPHVILSEKWDKKANTKYMTSSVPFPHQDKSTYDSSMRQPLGRDFNTDRSFRNFTRPAVIHNAGVLIQPIRMAGAAQSKSEAAVAARKQIKRTAASVVTVAGGVARKGGRRK